MEDVCSPLTSNAAQSVCMELILPPEMRHAVAKAEGPTGLAGLTALGPPDGSLTSGR